jgi:hypothetical protein
MAIKTVAVAGASGNLGPAVVNELVKDFTVTVLTRGGSTTELPAGVKSLVVDYSDPASLTKALEGQDAVVSVLAAGSGDVQKNLIDASVAAGVQRFLPSEYGVDVSGPMADFPVLAYKIDTQKYLKTTDLKGLTYTFLYTGLFLDWGLDVGFIADVRNRKLEQWDDGSALFSTNRISTIGQAVVQILHRLDQTRNREVRLSEAEISTNQIIALSKKIDSSLEYQVTVRDSKTTLPELWQKIKADPNDHATQYDFIKLGMMSKTFDGRLRPDDTEALGIKKLSESEIQQVLAKYIK